MTKATRKYLIAGNWKMNKTVTDAGELVTEIADAVGQQTAVAVAVCPPFVALAAVADAMGDSNLQLGAQNMHPEASGAYTGEISAHMLRAVYASFVILGHSERRAYFHEDDAFINRKVLAALENNLKPILCVGETLEQREAGETMDVVRTQVVEGLTGVDAKKADMVVIAYEPVWAIGTGKTATPAMAQEVHSGIRSILAERFGGPTAEKIRILYGGSMKPENADDLLAEKDIDGGLIGGASLVGKSFVKLVESARKQAEA
ncbi:MAG: triose-phosphate isomerase [Opitutales bacterium]